MIYDRLHKVAVDFWLGRSTRQAHFSSIRFGILQTDERVTSLAIVLCGSVAFFLGHRGTEAQSLARFT